MAYQAGSLAGIRLLINTRGSDMRKTYMVFLSLSLFVGGAYCRTEPHLVFDDIVQLASMSDAEYGRVKNAAQSGELHDEYLVGLAYLTGYHQDRAPETALPWLGKAASGGTTSALVVLGIMNRDGVGLPPNFGEAQKLFSKAAATGNADAMFYLGVMIEFGQGEDADAVLARRWYARAAAAGSPDAQFSIGAMAEDGRGGSKDLVLAAGSYRAAALAGDIRATTNMARLYELGNGVEKNASTAIMLYSCAAADNEKFAEYNLGDMYLRGVGVPRDGARALRYMTRSAIHGYSFAAYALGLAYLEGTIGSPDMQQALTWFDVAEKLNYPVPATSFLKAKKDLSDDQIANAITGSYEILNQEIRVTSNEMLGFRRSVSVEACVEKVFDR